MNTQEKSLAAVDALLKKLSREEINSMLSKVKKMNIGGATINEYFENFESNHNVFNHRRNEVLVDNDLLIYAHIVDDYHRYKIQFTQADGLSRIDAGYSIYQRHSLPHLIRQKWRPPDVISWLKKKTSAVENAEVFLLGLPTWTKYQ